ncbi:ABC transporter ATP-binding protein [Parendozoicomonas haliclonae]|uniref:Putative multidrug resistance ABC transporter ATP-binding/permease protein YheH n=1 Tax=Parendozoicomonas haliclonae TaxID=1960125 RepID=A0A1X7AIK2_9GAMM|nr:ABC transporter ATP-binding protein [Parendozoicomonas haliclonae]SMA44103.1 putative multidrug resistance ABC transporter ATP-binding/permease protein YheH [Parendozoicomonas haliclonae]
MQNNDMTNQVTQKQRFMRLLRYGLPYKGLFIISMVMMLLATGAGLYAPVVMKTFIDDHVVPGNWDHKAMMILGCIFITMYIIDAVLSWFQTMTFQKVALAVVHDIRRQVFNHLFRLPMAYFDREPVGRLVSRVTNDTETIRDLFVQALPQTLSSVVTLTGVVIAMFLLDQTLALYCVAIMPLVFLSIYLYRRFSKPVFHTSRAVLSDINTRINESIQGMAVVQALRQQKRVSEQFEDLNLKYKRVQTRLVMINALLRPTVHMSSAFALAFMVQGFAGPALVGPVEVGLLYAFINYLDRMFEPLTQVSMQMQVWQQAVVSSERVFELLDEEPEPAYEHLEHKPFKEGSIEFRDVELSYDGKNKALDGISFKAEPGQFIALVGHTGSGKSSVMNLLMRFYQHQKGEILIDGQPLASISESQLRQQLGLVFQEPFIFHGSVAENIHLYQSSQCKTDIQQAAECVQADRFIEQLPDTYDEVLGERGQSLSTGEKQLLSFARTMAQDPRILLLDEATANIDSETEQAIKEALFSLRQGRTTLAIAHRLTTIEDADLIMVMDKGKIVQRGTHTQLVNQPGLYRDMHEAQHNQLEIQEQLAS